MVRKLFYFIFFETIRKIKNRFVSPRSCPKRKLFLTNLLAMNIPFIQHTNFENLTTVCKVIIIKQSGQTTNDRCTLGN